MLQQVIADKLVVDRMKFLQYFSADHRTIVKQFVRRIKSIKKASRFPEKNRESILVVFRKYNKKSYVYLLFIPLSSLLRDKL